LSIQQVSFFQSCFVTGNQICQVQKHIQVIGCNASLIRLAWFRFWKQRFCLCKGRIITICYL
jgi:hypothetical protein